MPEKKIHCVKFIPGMNVLVIMIVCTVSALYGYGILIAQKGYNNLMVQGYADKVALAVIGLREGIFPWTQIQAEDDQQTFLRIGNTAEMMSAGLSWTVDHISAYDQNGIRNLLEMYRGSGIQGFPKKLMAGQLLQYTLFENGMEYEQFGPQGSYSAEGDQRVMELQYYTADDDYFRDAVFIGDSRMVGVYEYAGIGQASFLAKVSMTIYNMMNTKVSYEGHSVTVRDVLTEHQFGKVYLMVGINELGTADTAYFIRAYSAVLDEIRQLQPDALVIVQAILHVTGKKDRTDRIFNNDNIDERNEALRSLAEQENIFYIDVNEIYDDENGNLRQDFSGDDVHLYGNCYGLWHDFLYEHGVRYR